MAGRRLDFKQHRNWAESLTIVLQLGLTMAGCIVSCFFAGRFIDQWLGIRAIATVTFTLFGIIGGAVVCYRQIMEALTPPKPGEGTHHNGRD
jgi:ATP synthase protein I